MGTLNEINYQESLQIDTFGQNEPLQELIMSPRLIGDIQAKSEISGYTEDFANQTIKQLEEKLEKINKVIHSSLSSAFRGAFEQKAREMEEAISVMKNPSLIVMNPTLIGLLDPKMKGYEDFALQGIGKEKSVFSSLHSKTKNNIAFVEKALAINPLVIDYISNPEKLDKNILEKVYEYFGKNQNLLSTLDKNKAFISGFIERYKNLSATNNWNEEPLSVKNLPADFWDESKTAFASRIRLAMHQNNTLRDSEKAYLAVLEENPTDIQYVTSLRENPEFVLALMRTCKNRINNNPPKSYAQINLKDGSKYNFAYILRFAGDNVKQDWGNFVRPALKEGLIDDRDFFEILSQEGMYEKIKSNIKDLPASAKLFEKLNGNVDGMLLREENSWTEDEITNLKNNPWLLQGISEKTIDSHSNKYKSLVLRVVSLRGSAIAFAPKLKSDPTIGLAAVKQNGIAIRFLDKKLKANENLAFEAIKNTGYAFKFISDDLKNNESFLNKCAINEKSSQKGDKDSMLDSNDSAFVKNEKIEGFGAKYICEALFENKYAHPENIRNILSTLANTHGKNFGEIIFKNNQSYPYVQYIYKYFPQIKNDKIFLNLVLSYSLEKDERKKFYAEVMVKDLKGIVENTRQLKTIEKKNESLIISNNERQKIFCEFLKNKKNTDKILKIAEDSDRFNKLYGYIEKVATQQYTQKETLEELKSLFSAEFTMEDIADFIKILVEFENSRLEIQKQKDAKRIAQLAGGVQGFSTSIKGVVFNEKNEFDPKKLEVKFRTTIASLSLEEQKKPELWAPLFFEQNQINLNELNPELRSSIEGYLESTKMQLFYNIIGTASKEIATSVKTGEPAPKFEQIIERHPDIIKKITLNWDKYVSKESLTIYTQAEKIVEKRNQEEVLKKTQDTKQDSIAFTTEKIISPDKIREDYGRIPTGTIIPLPGKLTFEMKEGGQGSIKSETGFEISTQKKEDVSGAIESLKFLKDVGLDFLGEKAGKVFIECVTEKLKESNLPGIDLTRGASSENKKILLGFFECIATNGELSNKLTIDALEKKYSTAVNMNRSIKGMLQQKKLTTTHCPEISLTDETGNPKPEAIRYALKNINPEAIKNIDSMPKAA